MQAVHNSVYTNWKLLEMNHIHAVNNYHVGFSWRLQGFFYGAYKIFMEDRYVLQFNQSDHCINFVTSRI